MKKIFLTIFVNFIFLSTFINASAGRDVKIIICGIGRDVEEAAENTIANIEALGSRFKDYAVIIYENNSKDQTSQIYSTWAEKNKKVLFISENINEKENPISRCEKLARARNTILAKARDPKYADYPFLLLADLDFKHSWPIDEICLTTESKRDWDCVSSNGINENGYYDFYAFRNDQYPFGPELMGDNWWRDLMISKTMKISFSENSDWVPVFSAFGGLAIYKTKSILSSTYSGIVTEDLLDYYKTILTKLPMNHPQLIKYAKLNGMNSQQSTDISIIFRINTLWEHPKKNYSPITCIEHMTMHATMAKNGFGKFFINPKMIMRY